MIGLAFTGLLAALMTFALLLRGAQLPPTVDLLRPAQVPGRTTPLSRQLVRGALSLYLHLAPALLPLGALALLPSWGARLDAQLLPLLPLGTLSDSVQAHLGMGWLHAGLRGLIWALGPVLCTRLLLLAAAAPAATTARPWRQSPRLAAALRGLHGPPLGALVRFVGLFTLLNLCPLLLGALWARANPNEAMTGLTRSLPLFGLQLCLFLLSSLAGPLLAQQPQPLGRLLRVSIARSLAQPVQLASLVSLLLAVGLGYAYVLMLLQMGQSALLPAASLLLQALLLPFVWLCAALWVRHRL